MKQRILSLLLAAVLLLSFWPALPVPAHAADSVNVRSAEELRKALERDGDVYIYVMSDIDYKLPAGFKWTDYDTEAERFIWAHLGKGQKVLSLNGHKVGIDDDFVKNVTYVYDTEEYYVDTGNVSEDWFRLSDPSGDYKQNAALIRISAGASLTIYGGGSMLMTAQLPSQHQMRSPDIMMERDLFDVDGGELTIFGGSYQAGRSKSQYTVLRSSEYDYNMYAVNWYDGDNTIHHRLGMADNVINGTVILLQSGKVTVNGGEFTGYGIKDARHWHQGTPVPVVHQLSGTLTVNDGSFHAKDCGDVFRCEGGSLTVRAGKMTTDAPEWLYFPMWAGEYETDNHAGCFKGKNGKIGIPRAAIAADPACIFQSGDTAYDPTSYGSVMIDPSASRTAGSLTWGDGTTGQLVYRPGDAAQIRYRPGAAFFPAGTLSVTDQYVTYEWGVQEQKSDGRWANVTDGWFTSSTDALSLSLLYDGWTVGKTYRLIARRHEVWKSTHEYDISLRAENNLYLKVEKTAETPILNAAVKTAAAMKDGSAVGIHDWTCDAPGVQSVSALWKENGVLKDNSIVLKNGIYQLIVQLNAAPGYVFTADTKVRVMNLDCESYRLENGGKALIVRTEEFIVSCGHQGDDSSWESSPDEHWKICSVCGEEHDRAAHAFGAPAVSGGVTSYTCSACGYVKTVENGREGLGAVLIRFDLPLDGQTVAVPTLAPEYQNKAKISSYQWYQDAPDFENRLQKTALFHKGVYYLSVTLTPADGYYFTKNATTGTRYGTRHAVDSVSENALTVTFRVVCQEVGRADVVIPPLKPGSTMEDLCRGISAFINGENASNLYVTVGWGSNSYTVRRALSGEWSMGTGGANLAQFFAAPIQPGTLYSLELQISTGRFYVPEERIHFESGSTVLASTKEGGETWCFAGAEIVSESGEITEVAVGDVVRPQLGASTGDAFSFAGDGEMHAVGISWSENGPFRCGHTYTVTVALSAADGYHFSPSLTASLNSMTAEVRVSGSLAEIRHTFPVIEHTFGAWTETPAGCEDEGRLEHVCSVCGERETVVIPALGHNYYAVEAVPSTCVTQGVAAHYLCRSCYKCFDTNKNERTIDAMRLPLDPHNHEGGALTCDESTHYVLCVCGAKLDAHAHTWGEWTTAAEPTETKDGVRVRACTECGYSQSETLAKTSSPVTEPPVTQPPVTQPPVTQPPVTQAPVTQAPVTQPPVTQPPVTQPPVTQAPVTQPPTATDTTQPATPQNPEESGAAATEPTPSESAEKNAFDWRWIALGGGTAVLGGAITALAILLKRAKSHPAA